MAKQQRPVKTATKSAAGRPPTKKKTPSRPSGSKSSRRQQRGLSDDEAISAAAVPGDHSRRYLTGSGEGRCYTDLSIRYGRSIDAVRTRSDRHPRRRSSRT